MSVDIKYKYFINGDTVYILQYKDNYYTTPYEDNDDGVLIRYSESLGSVSSETDTLNINYSLQQAIIHYVRYRLYLRQGNAKLAEISYNKFIEYVRRSRNSKIAGYSKAIPQHTGVLK